jgi:hypothetical protein
VGFVPIGKGKYGEGDQAQGRSNETYFFEGQELLEWSIVHVPSNRGSVGRSEENEPESREQEPENEPKNTPISILEKHLQLINQK